ncbi:MAG: chemotaxis protein CheW [Clostridia bacterium]|nr:chemotaxis protein CheW [Clostridia bacterium]
MDLSVLRGKYLTFKLLDEEYAISINNITEIIGLQPITPVPNAPYYVRGVINLRGVVIDVMDLKSKLGIMEKEYDEKTSIIVVDVEIEGEEKKIGIIVDAVEEVTDIDDINESSSYNDGGNVCGIGKIKDRVVMMLDIKKLISGVPSYNFEA